MRVGCSPTTLRETLECLVEARDSPPAQEGEDEQITRKGHGHHSFLSLTHRGSCILNGFHEAKPSIRITILPFWNNLERKKRPQQWWGVVSPRQCPMPQVNAGDQLEDRQGNENSVAPTIQSWFSPLRLLVSTHERQPQESQVSLSRGSKASIKKYLKRLLKKGFKKVFQDWKRRMKKFVDVWGSYFEETKFYKWMKINSLSPNIF